MQLSLSANEQPFETNTNWEVIFCARHFFCSQVFKTTSNVLNSVVKKTQDSTFNMQQNTVLLLVLGRCFTFFTLCDQLVAQQKCFLQVKESCCEKQSAGLLRATNFHFVSHFSSNLRLVTEQICSFCATHQMGLDFIL